MLRDFRQTCWEVVQGIAPIAAVILLVQIFLLDAPLSTLFQFLLGSTMVILGITLFLIGVKVGLLPMGEAIGSEMPRSGSVIVIAVIAFLFGFLATIAEPDVRVLTSLIEAVSDGSIVREPLIMAIAIGVGFFVSVAVLRIIYGVRLAYLLAAGYGSVILLSIITPKEFLPIAFDAGGVTTGPVTVPFILALGIGVTSVLGGRSALSDGFGLIGLASIGPILGVMVLGVVSL